MSDIIQKNKNGTSGRVLEWLERYIKARKLQVGDALPREQTIAAATRSGRSSVREALTALKVLGIIRSRRKGGIRIIRDPVLLEIRHYFAERYVQGGRYANALEFRAAMEWGFGELLLARITPAAILSARKVVRDVADASAGKVDIEAAEVRFHTVLTRACGNRLALLFAHLYNPIFRHDGGNTATWAKAPANIAGWVQEHSDLLDALGDRDSKRFLNELKKHTHGYMRWPDGTHWVVRRGLATVPFAGSGSVAGGVDVRT